MKFKSSLLLLSLIYVGCSSLPKEETIRLPQSSVYEEAEVLSDDADVVDAVPLEDDQNNQNPNKTVFDKICREASSSNLKIKNRVVTTFDGGKYITGNIAESYQSGSVFVVNSDYGVHQASRMLLRLKRNAQELSKALDCVGTKSQKVYGLFKVDKKYYTGHVREVFKNEVVRFADDRHYEHFSSVDQSRLEVVGSKYKLKKVFFFHQGRQVKGEIRRVFEKEVVLIKYNNQLFVRQISEVAIED